MDIQYEQCGRDIEARGVRYCTCCGVYPVEVCGSCAAVIDADGILCGVCAAFSDEGECGRCSVFAMRVSRWRRWLDSGSRRLRRTVRLFAVVSFVGLKGTSGAARR